MKGGFVRDRRRAEPVNWVNKVKINNPQRRGA